MLSVGDNYAMTILIKKYSIHLTLVLFQNVYRYEVGAFLFNHCFFIPDCLIESSGSDDNTEINNTVKLANLG